jgi:hypothetical protein
VGSSLQKHLQRVALSWQENSLANESFATAPEEPSHVEMAFHIEINMMMAIVAHDVNSNL